MDRFTRIQSVTFGEQALGLPLWAKVFRRVEPLSAAGDADRFTRSVQFGPAVTGAEVKVRDVAAAEGLSPGQKDTLTLHVVAADASRSDRVIEIAGAVLTAVEIEYAQGAPAAAVLRFEAESSDGQANPFAAEDDA